MQICQILHLAAASGPQEADGAAAQQRPLRLEALLVEEEQHLDLPGEGHRRASLWPKTPMQQKTAGLCDISCGLRISEMCFAAYSILGV